MSRTEPCIVSVLITAMLACPAVAQTPQDQILGVASQLGKASTETPEAKPISLPNGAAAWVQLFERGVVYLLPGKRTQVVAGAILQMWSNMGGQGGSLGLPAADEESCPDGSGNRFQLFERGSIVFQPSTQRIGFSVNPGAPCQVMEFGTVPMSTKTAAIIGSAITIADVIVDALRESREKKAEAARKAAANAQPPSTSSPPRAARAYETPAYPANSNLPSNTSAYTSQPATTSTANGTADQPPPSSTSQPPGAYPYPPPQPSSIPSLPPQNPYPREPPSFPASPPPEPYQPLPPPPPSAGLPGGYTPIPTLPEQAQPAGPTKFYLAEPASAKQVARAADQLKKAFNRERSAHPMLAAAAATLGSLVGVSEAQTRALPIDWKKIKSALEPIAKDKSEAKVLRATQWAALNMGLSRQLRTSVRVETAGKAQQLAGIWQWQQASGTTEANQGMIFVPVAKAAPGGSPSRQARALEVPIPLTSVLSSGGNQSTIESSAASALETADTDVAYLGTPIVVNRGYRHVRMAAMVTRADEISAASYSGFGLGQTSVSLRVLDGDRVVCSDPRPGVRFALTGPGGDKLSGQDQVALACDFDRPIKDATVYSVIVVVEAGAATGGNSAMIARSRIQLQAIQAFVEP